MTMTVMRASAAQRNRVTLEEGIHTTAYKDSVGVWTIGKGHAATNPIPVRGMLNGQFYQGPPKEGVTITPVEVERLFDLDMDETERGISELVTAPVNQAQFDALCDFVHQYGLSRFRESTLLVKINFNPNSPAVLEQFMRWTRAGGEHQEYVWRRSARRCCIYNGTPIPQALWRKNGFPFAITADDKIDYSITPTIEKIIAYGKKAAEPYKFDPSKPLPEPVAPSLSDAVQSIPTQLPLPDQIEDEDELFLDTPAAPIATDAKGSPPVSEPPSPSSQAAVPPQPDSNPAASPAGSRPAPASVAPQSPAGAGASPLPPPKPPIVIAPKSVDVRSIPYGEVAPENGAKNMSESQRVIGMVIVGVGSVIQVVTTRLGVGGVIGAVTFDLSRDPVVVALIATGVVVAIGWFTRKRGTKVVTKGMVSATQLLK